MAVAADGHALAPSIFAPVSKPAFAIRELSFVMLGISAAIFVIVAGITLYAIVRFRRRPDDGDREPPQGDGSVQIELAWTVVPLQRRSRDVRRGRGWR